MTILRGLSLVCLLGWLVAESGAARGADERPFNMVLVVADDLGWSDLQCYGADVHETPNIDRLAAEGTRFTRAYSASVCTPTRASLITGKHHARLHMTTWYEASSNPTTGRELIPPVTVGNLPHAEVTLAEVFREAGYGTALVGKWHLGDAEHAPETQGFDINIGGTHWGAPHTYFSPFRGAGRYGGEYRYVPHLEGGKRGEHLTDRLTDEAIRVIDLFGERPFFLMLTHHAPHTPIEAKPELIEHYSRKIGPDSRHRNPAYAAMVHGVDESVGRLVAHLERRKLLDRTVIIFTSDNGGYVNEYAGQRVTTNAPLRSGKGSLHEGGIRVPLIARWPGLARKGTTCDEPVTSHDLFPTLREGLELSGGPPPTALDGVSLVGLLRDPRARLGRDALYFHYPHYYPTTTPVSAVRSGAWKLLRYHESGKRELYDLDADPAEERNLAGARPEVVEALDGRLSRWLTEVDARMPRRRAAPAGESIPR